MTRRIVFFPADDRSDPDPSKSYGVNCVDMRFLVEGAKGAVEFQLLTQWYLRHVMDRRLESIKRDVFAGKEDFLLKHFIEPYPTDVCYFSHERLSEDDSYWEKGVEYVFGGAPCYYGYKFMDETEGRTAKEVAFDRLVVGGDDALFRYLEEYYTEVFGKE